MVSTAASNAARIDSRCLPPAQRVEYWRDMISSSFVALDCEVPESTRFSGTLSNGALGKVQLSRVVAGAQRVARTPARIRQNPEDFLLLSFQVRGCGRVLQAGRDALLQPGDFALYDSTQPYGLVFEEDFDQIVLRLPRVLLGGRLRGVERLAAVPFTSQQAAANLAFGFVQRLAGSCHALAPGLQAGFEQALVDILVATLGEPLGTPVARAGQGRVALRERIGQYVERHLGQPGLDCRRLAAAHGISTRYLGKLFADEALSPSEWIWSRRLERAREVIATTPAPGPSLTELAYDCGFKDPAHFSRAFKARFGVAPSQARKGLQ